MQEDPSFNACGLDIKPLRLHHGGSYMGATASLACKHGLTSPDACLRAALGFVFGQPGSRVAYLSDTNGIPDRSMELLKAEPIDVLVLDALFLQVGKLHASRACMDSRAEHASKAEGPARANRHCFSYVCCACNSASTRPTLAYLIRWMSSASSAPNGPISPA